MDLFERLRRAAGQIDWGAVAGAMAENLGANADASQEIIDQLKEWGSHLTKNALTKWAVSVVLPVDCDSPDVSSGRPRPCPSYAVVRCDVCSRPCCLAHARVDYMGDAICEVCIGEAKARARAGAGGYARPHAHEPRQARQQRQQRHQEPPPPPAERKYGEMTRAQALRTLKLDSNATWDQIKAAYRQLVVKHNADRPQTDHEREKNTARLKKINAAFEVLKAEHDGKAAA